jgi:hypothetical protein
MPVDLYERTCQVLEHCFTLPLVKQSYPTELGEPLSFLNDQGLDMQPDEKVWLYSIACLWVWTDECKTSTPNEPLAFDPRVQYGTGMNNLLLTIMVRMRKQAYVSSSVAFSLDMVLDVQQELGAEFLGRSFDGFHAVASRLAAQLNAPLMESAVADDQKHIRDLQTSMLNASINVDFSSGLGEKGNQLAGDCLSDYERSIYRMVPMMIGLREKQWQQQVNEITTNTAARMESALNLAHFYNAAKISKALDPATSFPDMDYIIERQSKEYWFVGGLPTSRQEAAAKQLSARGLSPAESAPKMNRRKNIVPKLATKRTLRPLSDYLVATTMSQHGILKASPAMKNPGIRVENLVAAHLALRDDPVAPEKQCDLSWVQKVQLYTEAMVEDELHIAFDPVPFSERARVFMQDVRDMCKREAPDVYRAELFAKDEELGDFLGAMLAMPWQNNRTWAKACEMLKELIEEYGGTELLRAKERVGLETAGLTDDKREMGLGEDLNLTKGEESVEKVTEKLYTRDKGQEKEI